MYFGKNSKHGLWFVQSWQPTKGTIHVFYQYIFQLCSATEKHLQNDNALFECAGKHAGETHLHEDRV